jgi:hypothetical protein
MARVAAASRRATPNGQPQDAEAGLETLLRVRPLLENEIAEHCGSRAYEDGVPADAADRPIGITAVAGWHVVGDVVCLPCRSSVCAQ